jgi:uncharacterized membrane protein YdfJ with MMPL/SSD domain
MLYEPPKTKKYIIVFGTVALVVAVLSVLAIQLFYKSEESSTPIPGSFSQTESKQQKIQKQSQRLDQLYESAGAKSYTLKELEQQSKKLDELKDQLTK